MPHIAELLTPEKPDADGVIHIGRATPGCRHCGQREMKYSENGRVALHHPGTQCCPGAIKDQLTWRKDELARLRAAASEYQREMDETEKIANSTVGADAQAARSKLAKMQRAYPLKVEAWRRLTDGDARTGDFGIKQEIAELEAILRVMAVPA